MRDILNFIRRYRGLGVIALVFAFIVGLVAATPSHAAAPKHLTVQAAPKHLAIQPLAYTSGWSAYHRCNSPGANDYKIRAYFRGSAVGYQPDDVNIAWNQATRPTTNFDFMNLDWRNSSGTVTYQSAGYQWDSPLYGPTTFDVGASGYTVRPTYSLRLELWKGNTYLCSVTIIRA